MCSEGASSKGSHRAMWNVALALQCNSGVRHEGVRWRINFATFTAPAASCLLHQLQLNLECSKAKGNQRLIFKDLATLNEKMYNLGLEVTIPWLGFVTLPLLPSVHRCYRYTFDAGISIYAHSCCQLLSRVDVTASRHSLLSQHVTSCKLHRLAPPL